MTCFLWWLNLSDWQLWRLMASAGPWGRWGCDCVNSPLCFLVILLQLSLRPYQTETFEHCALLQCLCAFSFKQDGWWGEKAFAVNSSHDPQHKTLFPSKYFLTIFVFSLWKLCSCWLLWGWSPWFSLPPFLLCINANVSHSRAVLVSDPSLWPNTMLIENLTFFLGRIFKEWA